jgi:DNA-binding NtrC family response regulator
VASILVVDDNQPAARLMSLVLREAGHDVRAAADGVEALVALEERTPDLVISDVQMPRMDGLELLQRVTARWAQMPVIMVSVMEDVAVVVRAIRQGAVNYLLKPCTPESIQQAVAKALVPGRPAPAAPDPPSGIVGRSPAMVEVRHLVALAARSDANVLIVGETGSGKEVVSRAVHARSKLAQGPFVAHNCAATPPELFESQFFGYRKGAFTGADRDQPGLLESADGGVLFLDELGSMRPEHQAKLLRVIDDGEVRRVGEPAVRRVSVRYLAAINRDPAHMLRAGLLREDLYFRLRGIEFHLPPLRGRREDIPLLAAHFLSGRAGGLTASALAALAAHDWPGNVRELRSVVRSAADFAGDGPVDVEHLRPVLRAAPAALEAGAPGTRSLQEIEEDAIRGALEACGGNRTLAARALGIDRSTLRRKLDAMARRSKPPGDAR